MVLFASLSRVLTTTHLSTCARKSVSSNSTIYHIVQRSLTSKTAKMGEKITYGSQNTKGDVSGILFGNPKQSRYGMIVLHEWWGMNNQIQEEGAMIARDGNLTVLIPDLYRGKVAKDREEAGHYMADLDWTGAIQDVSGAAKYLKSHGCAKVAVMGFCLGGALSFASAAAVSEIDAAVPFYGIPGKNYDLTKIRIPVQGHFGELDDHKGFSSPSDYIPLNERLLAAGVPFEMHTYPTGHAFTNPTNPNYNKEIVVLALGRVYKFIHQKFDTAKV